METGDPTMFSKTKLALSIAMILGTAFSASAATTKPHHVKAHPAALFDMVPDSNGAGASSLPFGIEAPDRFGISSQR
jgi:hypothetical protein